MARLNKVLVAPAPYDNKEFTVSYCNGPKRNKRITSKRTDELEEVYKECRKLDREMKQNITISDFLGNYTVFEKNQDYGHHKPYGDFDKFWFE